MDERKHENAEPRKANERAANAKPSQSDEAHRLRGDTSNDAADAEGDSCVVIRHRDEKESDS